MNVNQFLEHWRIAENPFRAEEARHDGVFRRAALSVDAPAASVHSEFDKVLGELSRPTTSVVFGEKGSGKTAIRMQIEERVRAHNARSPDAKQLIILYDDLDPFVGEMQARFGSTKDAMAAFNKYRLVDHLDAVLSLAVGRLVSSLVLGRGDSEFGEEAGRTGRRMPPAMKQDLVLLQALFDAEDGDGSRTRELRDSLRMPSPKGAGTRAFLCAAGWIPAAAALAWIIWASGAFGAAEGASDRGWIGDLGVLLGQIALGVALVGYGAVLVKYLAWDRLKRSRLARRTREEMRSLARSPSAIAASLASVDPARLIPGLLPDPDHSETARYQLLERFTAVLQRFGHSGILVLIDRVDEPTLVAGDAEKMRLLIWPLFNSRFLQLDRVGVKLLLPIELRHALFRESQTFFSEARLDKQSLVERLSWTGPMLYDLCNARIAACTPADGEKRPAVLADLFADNVTRQDLIDALDQMQQPRDAFKFLYRCIAEHCQNVSTEDDAWQVPRLVLDTVRRSEADRVQQLHRGVRPA
ncbi:MAG: hypothetical protein AAFR38_12975 [Planctomycetota bacterium]